MDGSSFINGEKATGGGIDALLRALLRDANQPLARASTLPPEAYTSEGFFRLEVERILRKQWLVIGHVSQLPRRGDYFSLDLLGEMIVVVRAADRIRALSRICLHRWAPLVNGSGNTRRLFEISSALPAFTFHNSCHSADDPQKRSKGGTPCFTRN